MQSPKQLSLKHVTLYTSPLAFFQREAKADGGNDYILEVQQKERDLVGEPSILESQYVGFRYPYTT
jgi:hypothetical protein